MKAILLMCLIGLGIMLTQTSGAQTLTVKGQVVDASSNESLPGATVSIKGTGKGTLTDMSGGYSIQVASGQTLVFTSVGYTPQEIVVGNSTTINVRLETTDIMLDEAVVTAEFGIKRSARAVGASTQTVKGSEIAESGRENFVNSLQGRVAGVQITNSGGTPGSSSSVLIRGATSISGNNQPLYVIDGIPMSNTTFNPIGGLASKAGADPVVADRNLDFSNRGSDLNPEDIQSITVLKGAAAAALYGSDASNGAIIITTKKGKIGRGIVNYNNYFRLDQAYRYPEMQTKYDNGMYGNTNYYTSRRFGAEYAPGTQLYDNLANLFQTGVSQKHNLSFEAGSESLTFRAAASTTQQTGIVPTSSYTRDNISASGTAKLSKWMNIEASLTYANVSNTKVAKGTGGVLQRAMVWPLTDDMTQYLDAKGDIRYPNRYADVDILNPYFDLYKNKNYDETQRFISNMVVNIIPIKDMLIRAQVGFDVSSTTMIIVRHPQWSSTATGTGSYDQSKVNESNPTINIISTYKKELGKFNASAQVGYHQVEQGSRTLSVHGEKFMVADFQSINNCDISTLVNTTRTVMRRLQAVSGSFEFSYNNMAFLTLRGRNDWSSTLPVNNNSYFYPAADASFIVSELPFFKSHSETFSYLKLRGSVTQVGKDAPPLSIYPALEAAATSYGGYRYGFTGPNPNLRPEMNTAWEVGIESRLFKNRLDIDFSYYNTFSKDQIITGFRMSYATGFVLNNMNVGSFKTSGVELRIAGDLVKSRNLTVNAGINLTKNWSNVVSLPENVSEYYNAYTWNSGNIRNGIKVGFPITSLTGQDYQRNLNGQVLIEPSTGFPLISGKWSYLADREPKFLPSFFASVKYKNISIYALLDGRVGATVVNGTKRYMQQYGYSTESVIQREAAPVVFNGVLKDTYEETTTPTTNTIGVKLGDLQYGYSGADPDWIEQNINYLRLAEVRLSYNLDKKWLATSTNKLISAASVFVTGSDLFVWTNYSGIDVVGNSNSAALGGTGGVGQDMMAIAAPRGISFGLSVTF
ncbi:MAG: SusC/RagA family TonB-linked outer membrane protein [Bacteroidota bacterium]|nr:SusC/RagA family TonB-linked outer membrane protein [Bacteroidota bacterium]